MRSRWRRWRGYMDEMEELMRVLGEQLREGEALVAEDFERDAWPLWQRDAAPRVLVRRALAILGDAGAEACLAVAGLAGVQIGGGIEGHRGSFVEFCCASLYRFRHVPDSPIAALRCLSATRPLPSRPTWSRRWAF